MRPRSCERELGRALARAIADHHGRGEVVGDGYRYLWLVEPWTAVCLEDSLHTEDEWDDPELIASLVEEGHANAAAELLSEAGPGAELVVDRLLDRSQFGLSVIAVRVPQGRAEAL